MRRFRMRLLFCKEPDERRTIVTGDNGFFSFEEVKAGTPVRVEVSAPDLKSWSSNEIILQPGQSFIVTDISLGVANVETAVNAASPEEVAAEQVKIQEQQRVFGVVPNFYVTYEHDPAPLTPKLKFQLAMKALTDPVTIAGFGMNAAIYQAAGYPSYRQGAAGYGKRLGATFAGGYSKILLGDAVFPSLLHQDPRYFYQGTGTTKSRLLHAMATPFITRGDDGQTRDQLLEHPERLGLRGACECLLSQPGPRRRTCCPQRSDWHRRPYGFRHRPGVRSAQVDDATLQSTIIL